MDFLCFFEGRSGDTFWELLAVTGSILGSSQWFPEPPDQAKFCPPARPAIRSRRFFSGADFGATKWVIIRQIAKKDVQLISPP